MAARKSSENSYNHYQILDAKDAAGNEAFLHAGATSAWGILIGDERGLFSVENSERALARFTELMGEERFKLTIRDAMPVTGETKITRKEFNAAIKYIKSKGEPETFTFTDKTLEDSTIDILKRVNALRNQHTILMSPIDSYWEKGYKSPNGIVGEDAHYDCKAIDFSDPKIRKNGVQTISNWIMTHLSVLQDCGLYMMHPMYTPGWVHLQTQPPASGDLVFDPSGKHLYYFAKPTTARELIRASEHFNEVEIDEADRNYDWGNLDKMSPVIIQNIIDFREWTATDEAKKVVEATAKEQRIYCTHLRVSKSKDLFYK